MATQVKQWNLPVYDKELCKIYDLMRRDFMEKKILETSILLDSGINFGRVLNIGSGPNYVGLDWLKNTTRTNLVCVDKSQLMHDIALENTKIHDFTRRIQYVLANGENLPFFNNTFHSVFSIFSLHEWENPKKILDELFCVLKPEGTLCIVDLKRETKILNRIFMKFSIKQKQMQEMIKNGMQSSYTCAEIDEIMESSHFKVHEVYSTSTGLIVIAKKL
jgi:ubiquinone/menaquinone biosynthesis C-methylase UbiE